MKLNTLDREIVRAKYELDSERIIADQAARELTLAQEKYDQALRDSVTAYQRLSALLEKKESK